MIQQLLRRTLLPSSVSSVSNNRRCFNYYTILLIVLIFVQIQYTISERWGNPQDDDPNSTNDLVYHVPSFTVRELLQPNLLSKDKEQKLYDTLSSTGLLAISFDDDQENSSSRASKITTTSGKHYDDARTIALSGLCSCAEPSDSDSTNTVDPPLFRTVVGNRENLLSSSTISRTTLATATAPNNVPLSLPVQELTNACGFDVVHAMETLRDTIVEASDAFVQTVDHLLYVYDANVNTQEGYSRRRRPPLLRTVAGELFPTIQSVVQSATHLEHFHVYRRSAAADGEHIRTWESQVNRSELVLDIHTDAGLFLSFVPGLSCSGHPSDRASNGLFVQTPDDHQLKEAIFPPNSVGILLGIGMQQWLATSSLSNSDNNNNIDHPLFQATKHAVFMKPGATRSWYGRMHLVPPDTIIQEYPVQRTFADMRKGMVVSGRHSLVHKDSRASTSDAISSTSISIGCGSTPAEETSVDGQQEQNGAEHLNTNRHHRRRLQMVDDPSVCNNSTNFYCWMSCLAIPDAQHAKANLNEGLSLYCADPATLDRTSHSVAAATKPCNEYVGNRVIIGGAMNGNCVGIWQPTADNVPATPVKPINTTDDNGSSSSSKSAVDDNTEPWCYGGTSMYMDGFHWIHPICVIYLFPSWILSTAGAMIGACFGTIVFGILLEGIIRQRRDTVSEMPIGWKRLSVSTVLYGVQLTAGYMIMLVVMTYSGPLFFSVIIGLMSGHFLWNMKDIFDTGTDTEEEEARLEQKSINNNTISSTAADEKSNTSSETPETVPYDYPNNDNNISCCCPPETSDPNHTTNNMDPIDAEALAPCCSIPPEMNSNEDPNGNGINTYGSIADESNYLPSSVTSGIVVTSQQQQQQRYQSTNKRTTKKKNIVPEGCTPCCQNAI